MRENNRTGGIMVRLLKAKRLGFIVFGLALATVAIVAGCGVGGGSGAASGHLTPKAAGHWRAIANAPAPIASERTTIWTGSEMIVTGVNPGSDGTYIDSTEVAEAYNPRTNAWRMLPAPPKTENYCKRSAVWTGSEMLVWGCEVTAYDPKTNHWLRLPDAPTRHGIVAWTGRELIGWGGGCCGDVSDDGSAYSPATNTWRKLAPAPINGQQSPIGAWTGRELVIFNGHGPEGDRVGGAAYNPETDSWRRIPSQPGIRALTAVYDGNEIYAVGGLRVLAFNPSNNSRRQLPRTAVGAGDLLAVWTGDRLIVTGSAAKAYDPPRDLWTTLSPSPLGLRQEAGAVWTGRELIVWGGLLPAASGSPKYLADGAAFNPPKYSAPLPQCSC
jgi:N-acetylneuraminic acid mutarotase